jgi:hypothetical protein
VLAKNNHTTTPGYYKLADSTGAVSVQVPSEWEYVMGVNSEVGANWSNFGGERILSSVTASSDLHTWHNVGEVPGIYAVASRRLARAYTDELVASGPNDFSFRYQAGRRRDFEPPLFRGGCSSGRIVTGTQKAASSPWPPSAQPRRGRR